MEKPNMFDIAFIRNTAIWAFLALQCAIGFATTIYWAVWLARDLGLLD